MVFPTGGDIELLILSCQLCSLFGVGYCYLLGDFWFCTICRLVNIDDV